MRLDLLTTASLLVSRSNGQAHGILSQEALLDVIDDNASRLIPALHARAGLNYSIPADRRCAVLAIGYEFHSYIRAMSRVGFPDDGAEGLATSRYENFDLHGVFASATLEY